MKKKTRSDLAMEKPSHPSLQATTSVAERTCKPGSVVPISRSRRKRATISLGRRFPATSSSRPGSGDWAGHPVSVSQPNSSLLGLAPDGVYRARPVTRPAGELLPHRFTLTARCAGRRSAFCCTFPGLTAGGRYPPSCPAEPGLSSAIRPAVSCENAIPSWQRPPGPLRLARRRTNSTDCAKKGGPEPCGNFANSWKAHRMGDNVASRQGSPVLSFPRAGSRRISMRSAQSAAP